MEGKIYTIKDVAKACGVSPSGIRFWIFKGKVSEVKRDSSGRRIFSQEDYDRFVEYARAREIKKVRDNEQI